MTKNPQILLTNDDGVHSPGLWAAAEALAQLGDVTVAAPRDQSTGAGRSLPLSSDGIIRVENFHIQGRSWQAYAIGGTPAQVTLHAILEIMPEMPQLVVSGINYGENISVGIGSSGTVGAAMESAGLGIPSLAISLQTEIQHHLSHSTDVNFSAAAHFTMLFARLLLERGLPPGVDLLKADVPSDATPETAWAWTRLSPRNYYRSLKPQRSAWDIPGRLGYEIVFDLAQEPHDTDVYTVLKNRQVSLTPLTLDMTARVTAQELAKFVG
jgi:5'-nucleotidase